MQTHFIAIASIAIALALILLAKARASVVWAAFFSALLALAALDRSVFQGTVIVGMAAILWAEHKFPRRRYAFTEPLATKLCYIFLKKATRPLVTTIVAAIGLSLWQPAWGLKGLGCPLWLQSLVVLFVVDFEKYWIHRAQHYSDIWWRFHKVHHIYREIWSLSFGPTHLGDFVLIQAFAIIGMSMFLGVDSRAVLYGYGIPTVFISGLWAHANLDIPRGKMPRWAYFLMTPNVHAVHHSQGGNRKNFAEIFSFWDVLFGTFLCPVKNRTLLEHLGVQGEVPAGSLWDEQMLKTRPLAPAVRNS